MGLGQSGQTIPIVYKKASGRDQGTQSTRRETTNECDGILEEVSQEILAFLSSGVCRFLPSHFSTYYIFLWKRFIWREIMFPIYEF